MTDITTFANLLVAGKTNYMVGCVEGRAQNHFHFACAKAEDPSSKLNHQGASYMNSEHGTLEKCLATNRGES